MPESGFLFCLSYIPQLTWVCFVFFTPFADTRKKSGPQQAGNFLCVVAGLSFSRKIGLPGGPVPERLARGRLLAAPFGRAKGAQPVAG
jgi:hypothetical protein